jgi:hypothetical protein
MRIVDRSCRQTYTHTLELATLGLSGEKPRNGASGTYVSTFDYQ